MHLRTLTHVTFSFLALAAFAIPACKLGDRLVDPTVTISTDNAQVEHGKRSHRSERASVLSGQAVAVGHGRAWTFVERGKRGKPVAFGVAFSKRALKGLPSTGPEVEYVLPLPRRANLAPFTHVGLNWNPHGHPPAGVYEAPHFDIHFYMLTEAERASIDGSRGGQAPDAVFVPPDYISTVDVVPHMGVHWVDVTAPELQPGGTFTRTMIYGTYDGVLAFIEPMVTRDFLRRGSSNLPIKQPAQVQRTGWYPTRWQVRQDGEHDRILVRLSRLVYREGTLGDGLAAKD